MKTVVRPQESLRIHFFGSSAKKAKVKAKVKFCKYLPPLKELDRPCLMTVGKLVDDIRRARSFPRKLEVVARAVYGQLAVRAVRFMAESQKSCEGSELHGRVTKNTSKTSKNENHRKNI